MGPTESCALGLLEEAFAVKTSFHDFGFEGIDNSEVTEIGLGEGFEGAGAGSAVGEGAGEDEEELEGCTLLLGSEAWFALL